MTDISFADVMRAANVAAERMAAARIAAAARRKSGQSAAAAEGGPKTMPLETVLYKAARMYRPPSVAAAKPPRKKSAFQLRVKERIDEIKKAGGKVNLAQLTRDVSSEMRGRKAGSATPAAAAAPAAAGPVKAVRPEKHRHRHSGHE